MRRARRLFDMQQVFSEPFQHLLLQQEFIHDESGNFGEAECTECASPGRILERTTGSLGEDVVLFLLRDRIADHDLLPLQLVGKEHHHRVLVPVIERHSNRIGLGAC